MLKNIIIVVLVVLVIFLGGLLAYKQFSPPKQKGLTKEQIFANKEKCASYRDKLIEEIEKDNVFNSNSITVSKLDAIFYSPSRNTCYYASHFFVSDKQSPPSVHYFYIHDYMTGSKVFETDNPDKYNKEIEKLKQ
jgi:hypothetical protein